MLMNELIGATGQVKIEVFAPDGRLKDKVNIKNLVVTTGREYIAARLNDDAPPAEMTHMAVGTGTTLAAAGDTTLETEEARVALTTDTITANEIEYVATWGPGVGTAALTEAGVFNDGTAGTMLCRTVFNVVNKAADDSMTITWTISIS